MNQLRTILALTLAIVTPLPAIAQPHVIAELGTSPLVGQIASTPQLQAEISGRREFFERAGIKLGLTPDEFAQFAALVAAKHVAYVTLPRRLDAMTWASGGHVYVLRDVVIPKNTKGWEADLTERGETIALFVPARCGNLSIVRRPLPALARVSPNPPVIANTAPTPAPLAMPAVFVPQQPAPTAAPFASVAVAAPPLTHHLRLWPLLFIPILAFVAGHHGGAAMPPITSAPLREPPPAPAPSPPPVSCNPTPGP